MQLVVDHCLRLVSMAGFQRRSAHTLSGGERQRLAVAGALAQVQPFQTQQLLSETFSEQSCSQVQMLQRFAHTLSGGSGCRRRLPGTGVALPRLMYASTEPKEHGLLS